MMKPFASTPCYCCSSTKDAFSGVTVVQVVSSRRQVLSVAFTSTIPVAKGTHFPQYCLTIIRHLDLRTQL